MNRWVTTFESVSSHTGVSLIELHQFVRHRERYYRVFRVPKKSGGFRKIQAPSIRLKQVQRWIATTLLSESPLHNACTGYRKGHSIVTNAMPHAGASFVFNVDIASFFPSIKEERVTALFQKLGYSNHFARQLAALTTVNGVLPQGAPSSPLIANLICKNLDERMQSFASQHGWAYTRYCDDITISGHGGFRGHHRTVFDIITSEGFEVNTHKVRYAGKNQRQEVTGLVVNAFVNVPRERRRLMRAMMHRARKQNISEPCSQNEAEPPGCALAAAMRSAREKEVATARLSGLLSFLRMVRPEDALLRTLHG